MPEARGQLARDGERVGVVPAMAQPAPAKAGAPRAGTVISGWSPKASCPASTSSPVAPSSGRRGAPGLTAAAAAAISASGHAQQHGVGAGAVGAATERAVDGGRRRAAPR